MAVTKPKPPNYPEAYQKISNRSQHIEVPPVQPPPASGGLPAGPPPLSSFFQNYVWLDENEQPWTDDALSMWTSA